MRRLNQVSEVVTVQVAPMHIWPQGHHSLEGNQASVGQRLLRINKVTGGEEGEDDLPAAALPRGSP